MARVEDGRGGETLPSRDMEEVVKEEERLVPMGTGGGVTMGMWATGSEGEEEAKLEGRGMEEREMTGEGAGGEGAGGLTTCPWMT